MRSRFPTLMLIPFTLLLWSCGPEGGEEDAPAMLEVEPETLDFAADEDTRFLEVKNGGGQVLTYSAAASATSDGVEWLAIEPAAGGVEGGSSRSLVVRVVNRDQLSPGSYSGEISVEADGLDSRKVVVTMKVGQPILSVTPVDTIDFGKDSTTEALTIENSGEGELSYKVQLPGNWVTTESALARVLPAGEPETMLLVVDRAMVPWYGSGSAEVIVTSNGSTEGKNSDLAKVQVQVYIDPACYNDKDCDKEGFFCNQSSGVGVCDERNKLGNACSAGNQCKSGFCVDEVCCDSACAGLCLSCVLPDTLGLCMPLADGTDCDDGSFCTDGDICDAGQCLGGPAMDCSDLDNPCEEAVCDEETASCLAVVPVDKCIIQGQCVAGGSVHPDTPCLLCKPGVVATDWTLDAGYCLVDGVCHSAGEAHMETDCLLCNPVAATDAWSLVEGACHIDGKCYQLGETVAGDCQVCNPAHPTIASSAVDGTACADDGNGCTSDFCLTGECVHDPVPEGPCDDGNDCTMNDGCTDGVCAGEEFVCDDGLDCTKDLCNGDGTCTAQPIGGYCLADGECVEAETVQPLSGGCASCDPTVTKVGWTPLPDGGICDDGDLCSAGDSCQGGSCVGAPVACDDGLPCTDDSCAAETGLCVSVPVVGWCEIDDECVPGGAGPVGADNQCRLCDPDLDSNGWTEVNQGNACEDLSACSAASQCDGGICVAVGPLCDDDNICTVDACLAEGVCEHEPVNNGSPCGDDGVLCTNDLCVEGECTHDVAPDHCLIDGACAVQNAPQPGSACAACLPGVSQDGWSAVNEGTQCALPGAFAQCLEGTCTLVQCLEGYDDCDDGAPGCETGVWYDPVHCGACEGVCALDNALDTCFEGECIIVHCKETFGDCDEQVATGCEVTLSTDPENCGECGKVCTTDDADKVGVCSFGGCGEVDCPDSSLNGDGLPGNGCELKSILFVDAANSSDPQMSGSPSHPFDTIQKAVDASDGGFTIYVRPGNYQEAVQVNVPDTTILGDEDGIVYVTVPDGETGFEVTASGVVVEGLTITGGRYGVHFKGDLLGQLQGGVAADLTVMGLTGPSESAGGEGDHHSAGIFVEFAEQVTVTGIDVTSVEAGQGGSVWAGAAQPCQEAWAGGTAAGIMLSGTAACVVVGNTVSTIQGGQGGEGEEKAQGGQGGIAAGIYLNESVSLTVQENSVSIVTGGEAGGTEEGEFSLSGGVGAGLYVKASPSALIQANVVSDVAGGQGGQGGQIGATSCGIGGIGAGLYLAGGTSGATLAENILDTITGGAGGGGDQDYNVRAADQQGFGFYFESDSMDNAVASSNLLEEEPIYYIRDAQNVTVDGAELVVEANPTNFGKIAVFDSSNVQVVNSTISGFQGEAVPTAVCGTKAADGVPPAFDGWGLYLDNCSGCQVMANDISGIVGGAGGLGTNDVTWYNSNVAPGMGGGAYGVFLQDSSSCSVSNNEFSVLAGGVGGTAVGGGSDNGGVVSNGRGGPAAAVYLRGSSQSSLGGNVVADIAGGPGGGVTAGYAYVSGEGGTASAVILDDSLGITVQGTLVRSLMGGQPGTVKYGFVNKLGADGGAIGFDIRGATGSSFSNIDIGYLGTDGTEMGAPLSACFRVADSLGLVFEHITCAKVGLTGGEVGHGFMITAEQSAPVEIANSIVAYVTGHGLANDVANGANLLVAGHTDFWECQEGSASNATIEGTCFEADPLFGNAGAGNFKLLSSSPCIDAGDEFSDCTLEPAPNGCATNLGAYGSTEAATAADGAQHCDICP
jgi:hypothetical protein